jgi:UDP-glucose 4-epimerase
MEASPKIIYLLPRQEVVMAFSDHSACHRIFGNGHQTPLEVGLKRMATWVKENGSLKSKEFGNIEVRHGLPPSWI